MSNYSYKPRQKSLAFSQPGDLDSFGQPQNSIQPQEFGQIQIGNDKVNVSATYKPSSSQGYAPTASTGNKTYQPTPTYQPPTSYQPQSGGNTPSGTVDYQNKYSRQGGGSNPTYNVGGNRQETPKSSGVNDFGGQRKEGDQFADYERELQKERKANEDKDSNITLLKIEITRLSSDLDDKRKELEELKRQLASSGKNPIGGSNPLAEQEVKRLTEANRDFEQRIRELSQDALNNIPLKEKWRQYEGLERKNKELEAEIKLLRAGPTNNSQLDQERIRDLEIRVGAYEDICHYYRKRIDAYETAFNQNNINPLLIKLLADSPDKAQNLSGPSQIRDALIEQNKQFERIIAQREGEVQTFKRRNDELENLLSQSSLPKDSSWQLRKECEKLKEQVRYQQLRIDQLIDMLLHHDIDIITGKKVIETEKQVLKVVEEEEVIVGGSTTEKAPTVKRRREVVKSSGRDDPEEVPPNQLDLLKQQFASALQEQIDKERREANDAIAKMRKAHEDELQSFKKKYIFDDKARENELQDLKNKLLQDDKARENDLQAFKNRLLQEAKAREDELQALRLKLQQSENARKEFEKATKEAEAKLRVEFEATIREQNRKYETEKRDYEEIIRKLRDDFDEFDRKMKELLRENDRLRALLEEKERDIQRLHDMNFQLQLENEEIVAKAETIEQDHEKLFDKRKKELEAYLKHLLDEEKAEFMNQVEEERHQYEDKFKEYDKIVDELEDRNHQFEKENERLTEYLQEKIEEIELWKSKYAILDNNRTAEIEELRQEFAKRGRLDEENEALRALVAEKEAAFIMFFIEIERLHSMNQEYDEEVAKLRKKDDELVEKYNEAVERLNNLDKLEIQLEKEKLDLRQIVADLNEQLVRLEEKLRNALDENKRLRSLHEERKKEIENLNIILNKGEEMDEYTKEDMRRRDLEMKEMINKYEFQIGELKAQVGTLDIQLKSKTKESDRQMAILTERKKENEEMRILIDQLKKETVQGRNLDAQLSLKTEQYNQALKELSEIQIERDHLQRELSEKNFANSIKMHQMIQQYIDEQATRDSSTHVKTEMIQLRLIAVDKLANTNWSARRTKS